MVEGIDVGIKSGKLTTKLLIEYLCEELNNEGFTEKVVTSEIPEKCEINFCPMCGRELRENEEGGKKQEEHNRK